MTVAIKHPTRPATKPFTYSLREGEEFCVYPNLDSNRYFLLKHASKKFGHVLLLLHFCNPQIVAHSINVSLYATGIALEMGLSESYIELLCIASLLHDVGKTFIPHSILTKPSPLTVEEEAVMKRHVEYGSQIIQKLSNQNEISEIVLAHHERYNGSGYPKGLKGHEIPKAARILSLADAIDAMVSKRPYGHSLNSREALNEIIACNGEQFDPDVVHAFFCFLVENRAHVRIERTDISWFFHTVLKDQDEGSIRSGRHGR